MREGCAICDLAARCARGGARHAASPALQAHDAIHRHEAKFGAGTAALSNPKLPALEPLLEDGAISDAISAYLGGAARYDGHELRLWTSSFAKANSTSLDEHWHHDRCGRRLQLFVYLHDVEADDRPTLVARGADSRLGAYLGAYLGMISAHISA